MVRLSLWAVGDCDFTHRWEIEQNPNLIAKPRREVKGEERRCLQNQPNNADAGSAARRVVLQRNETKEV